MAKQGTKHLLMLTMLTLVSAACGGSDDRDTGALVDIGDGDGELVVGADLDLPEFFPSDFYLPDGISIGSAINDPDFDMMSLSGTFEDGEPAAIQADAVAGLQAAGYELLNDDGEIAVFVRNGVGRIRVRTSVFLGQTTLSVDIDTWTDSQLDELRGLSAEEIVVAGKATAEIDGVTTTAPGECRLRGPSRIFTATDISITLQIDDSVDPPFVYADVTMDDGRVFSIDTASDPQFETSSDRFSASGKMTEYTNEGAGTVDFVVEASCEV